jgi:hypothetical protein
MKRQRKGYCARGAKRSASNRNLRRGKPGLGFEQLEPRLAMAVVINEFLADNETGLTDFAGEQQDWIELKNTGAVAENIGGWYLTDDSLNLTKWQIPAGTTIAAGQHLIIFASSKNLTGAELHTNFGLSNNGEDLALVMPNGVTIADAYLDFPAQLPDVSFGIGASSSSSVTDTLVGASSSLKVISPTGENAAVDDHWREIGFNDASWLSGTRSVGFDRNADSVNLAPFIGRTLTTGEMSNTQTTAYVRYSFNLADKDQLTSLMLSLRFDDGFIAYINGREVKRVNFGEDFARPQPQWDSFAGNHVQGSNVLVANRVEESDDAVAFDLTPYLSDLVNGTNVLAFHAVNSNSTSNSSTNRLDFLVEPILTATRATSTVDDSFMVGPTPNDDNGVGVLGFVVDTQFSHDRGFYDAAFNWAITTPTAGATIRYTTDGSIPSLTNGTTYSGPISIDPATIPNGNRGVVMIRAAAFKAGFAPTNIDTQSYVFLDKVIFQNGSGLPTSGPWGFDKDGDGNNGYRLDQDDKDWAMDPDIRNSVGAAQLIQDLKSIPSMSVVMDWDDLFGASPMPGTPPQIGTTPSGSSAVAPVAEGIYLVGRSDERYSSLEYFNPSEPNDQFQVDAAIEIQGHSSPTRWNTDKLSFQVKFKFPYGDTELNHPLFTDTPDGENSTSEFDTLILDAGFNYTWTHSNLAVQTSFARFVSDQVAADLQNLASGGGQAAHGKWVHLYLNGMYWGLYNVHERPDDSFAAEYFGGNKDDYYVIKHSTNEAAPPAGHKYSWQTGGIAAENAYQSLLNATRLVDADPSNAALYQSAIDVLDEEQFIDYMIVHMYAGNENDWPHNNWYATFNHVDVDGQWRFHSWDQEHAFPTSDNGDGFTQFADLTDTGSEDSEGPGELFHNLIGNENFRLKFADRVQELMYNGGALTPGVAQDVYEARLAEIDRAINGESARWGDNRVPNDPFTRQDFLDVNSNNTTGDLKAVVPDFFPVRTGAVIGHFEAAGWIPTLDAPLLSQYGGEVASGFDLALTKPVGSPGGAVIYYTLDGSDPRLANGTLNPAALTYSTPIDLTESTNVKTRIFFNNAGTADDWSPLEDRNFSVAEDPIMGLRIVELMYNPPGSADDTEYFEILNTGTQTADLTGVQITEFSAGGYTFAGGSLAAGQRIVVVKSQTAFAAAYPSVANVAAGEFSGSLSNEGEFVALRGPGPASVLIQSFSYGDSNVSGWPADADGEGKSLVYIGPFDANEDPTSGSPSDPYDNPTQWQASTQLGGSPGSDGAASSIPGDYDGNGTVETPDYEKWKTDFGMVVTAGTGSDGNGNGVVDTGDYTVWRDNLGATAPGASAGSGGGAAAFASEADDEEVAVEPAQVVYPFESSALLVDRTTVAVETSLIDATAVDANLLAWRSSNADGDEDSAVVDDFSAASDEADAFDLAGVWEDDDWLAHLGVS